LVTDHGSGLLIIASIHVLEEIGVATIALTFGESRILAKLKICNIFHSRLPILEVPA
jgi:hypothetical protein